MSVLKKLIFGTEMKNQNNLTEHYAGTGEH